MSTKPQTDDSTCVIRWAKHNNINNVIFWSAVFLWFAQTIVRRRWLKLCKCGLSHCFVVHVLLAKLEERARRTRHGEWNDGLWIIFGFLFSIFNVLMRLAVNRRQFSLLYRHPIGGWGDYLRIFDQILLKLTAIGSASAGWQVMRLGFSQDFPFRWWMPRWIKRILGCGQFSPLDWTATRCLWNTLQHHRLA